MDTGDDTSSGGCSSSPGRGGPRPDFVVSQAAFQLAERIERISDEVISSFQHSDPAIRVTQLQSYANQIALGMVDVISWIERKRSGHLARMTTDRMHFVIDKAIVCAGLDIPQYAGGQSHLIDGHPSIGARINAELFVTAHTFANEFRKLTRDIHKEENQSVQPGTQNKSKPSRHNGGKANLVTPKIPEKYRIAVKLWPEYRAEQEKSGRATLRLFREWLQRRQKPIFLDDQFDNWWNNTYRRQQRRRRG